MPRNFLPWLKSSLNQLQKKSPQNQSNLDDLSLDGGFSVSNPKDVIESKIPNVLGIAILITCLLFCFVLGVNVILDLQLKHLKNKQDTVVTSIKELSDVEQKVLRTNRKVSYYKQFLENRRLLSDVSTSLFEDVPPSVSFTSVQIEQKRFLVVSESSDVISFTSLIANYLEKGFVSEVILQSANFNPRDGIYTIEFEGILK